MKCTKVHFDLLFDKETWLMRFVIILMSLCNFISYFFITSDSATAQGNNTKSKIEKTFPEPKIKFAPKQYVCYKTNDQIQIDGKLNESTWEKTEWTDDFVDIEGDLKPTPHFRTRVKMLWDEQFFYFAAELTEPHVWATLKQRDTVIFYDNDFEVFIDPDGDTHQYYEFEMNAFSTEWDLFLVKPYRDGGPAVDAWDIQGLKTAVFVDGTINDPSNTDKGWTLEIAMPWTVLKECARKPTPPKSGDQWRINFSRVEWQVEVKNGKYKKTINPKTGKPYPENNWVWSPQGLINMHYPEIWGFVQFSEKIAGKGTDVFKYNIEENARWALRQIYYKQKTYFMRYGKFTENINDVGLAGLKIEGYTFPPKIKYSWNQFEAYLESLDGRQKWYICQNGRVWQTTSGK